MPLAGLFSSRRHVRDVQLAHALRVVPLFRAAPADDLIAVWRRLHVVRLPAGGVVCKRGEPGDRFYVIQSGSLEVRLGLGPDGVPIRLAGPGDFVGEMALLTGAPRSADVVAAEDSVLWALDRADFTTLVGDRMPLLKALNRVLCDRLIETMATLETHGMHPGRGVSGMRFGPYRVIEQLGSGGMSAVYSAIHESTKISVALKLLPASWGRTEEFRARLEREAAALRLLDHPNVVRLLDFGQIDEQLGGGCFLALEWVPQALDRVLRAQFPEPLPVAESLRIVRAVAVGLHYIHAIGLVHRDVKPSNILLRADGTPVLTDFGLVTEPEADPSARQRLTAPNVIVGTADYIAPEQVAGMPIDGRADLYALGIVLYELLAGHVPFAGLDPLETLRAHVELPPAPLSADLPEAVRSLVEHALEKRADDRFPSAAVLITAIDGVLARG